MRGVRQETDGLLKIEDVLPFFPDFVLIDDFKEAICTSLEEYNRQIGAGLRSESRKTTTPQGKTIKSGQVSDGARQRRVRTSRRICRVRLLM